MVLPAGWGTSTNPHEEQRPVSATGTSCMCQHRGQVDFIGMRPNQLHNGTCRHYPRFGAESKRFHLQLSPARCPGLRLDLPASIYDVPCSLVSSRRESPELPGPSRLVSKTSEVLETSEVCLSGSPGPPGPSRFGSSRTVLNWRRYSAYTASVPYWRSNLRMPK